MAETTPLLDRNFLQETFGKNVPVTLTSIPNIPYRNPSIPLPTVDGEPTPSALSAIENSVLSMKSNEALMGGSIPRSLGESISDRYNVVVPGQYNNEDAYAQGQGWPSRMVNGVGKGLLLTGTTLLQTTVGTLNGIARMTDTGRAASFYDNDLNRWLDDVNKSAENVLPNYYTDVEKNANWYSPNKLFTANFLWDGIVKNLGFAAGAAISGGLYASALRALPLTARLFSVGKGAETLAATEEALLSANKVADSYGKIKGLSDKFVASYQFMNPAGRALVAGLATTGEAGFEAFHNLNSFREQKIEEYKRTHGGLDPKGADLDAINSEADGVGNSSFLLNTALLSATNYIQFPRILGASYKAEKGLINSLKNDIAEVTTDASGNIVKKEAKTRAGKLLSTVNKIRPYTFSVSEGFEEGSQYAISVGTQDYYNKKYDGEVANFLESMTEGIKQTINTNEGMENVLIGGLAGAIMQGRGRFLDNAKKSNNTADAIQKFNKWRLSDFTKATIDSVNRGTVLQEERENALRQGDILTSKDKETDYIINYLTPRIKYGRFDLVNSDIQEYKRIAATDEGFAQLQSEGKALSTDTKEAYLQRLANLESTASNINSLYQSLTLRYGNLVLPDGSAAYPPEVMDQMIYAATKIADYDNRITDLTTSLLGATIDTTVIVNDLLTNISDSFNSAIQQIEKLDVTSDEKESLLTDLEDIAELSLRRQQFIKEYDRIKKNPTNYKNTPISTDVAPTVSVKTKDGEEDLNVGEEYFLGKVVEYDINGKEVYRFPKLTILGENPDGTIKIKDGKGNIKDVTKSVLEDYKLGKVSDTLSNKKAKFYMDNANNIFEFNFGKNKKQKGRLEYSPKEGILNFVYKDSKGKIRSIEVTGDQFVPKQGFSLPQISKVGTLSALDLKAIEEFAVADDARKAAKRTNRLKIINDLFNEISENHTKTQKLIEQKKSELANLDKDLEELRKKIESSELTPKKANIKSTTRRAIQASNRLLRMRDQLTNEIEILETEKNELELNAEYITDLGQNIDELPTDGGQFLEELKDQKSLLESAILETGKEINNIAKLIDSVESALESAIEFANSLISEFTKKYPKAPTAIGQEWVDFIQNNPNFLKLKPNYKEDLSQLEDIIAQIEDMDIAPNERTLGELRTKLSELQSSLEQTEKEIKAKEVIISKFEEIAEKYRKSKEEERKLAQDETLRKEILGTADPGVQTRPFDKDYEPEAKKTNIAVVTSTKAATNSTLPHHVRANTFGQNLDSFPNRANIKGVIVTSKTESQILPGLTNFLKGTSDVDASKIVVLVMVDENGFPVGVDGKKLSFDEGQDTIDNAVFQVMSDPKLEWSKEFGGGSMFRKETTPEQIEYYKNQYTQWINEQLSKETYDENIYDISASFGIPQYVTYLDDKGNEKRDYNAKVSVQDAGLIKSSDLVEKPIIFVPTVDTTVEKGSTIFNSPLGRPFLSLPNAYVPLQNRKLTKNEASTIYEAIHQLSIDIFKNGNTKSENSQRLLKWLKSIIYWGTPKNKAGYNSIWFDNIMTPEGPEFSLFISGKDKSYPFTPNSIEQNKGEIVTLIEGMYNNINSGLTDKAEVWNEEYEEIVEISSNGTITPKKWKNYQTYLLSQEDRKAEDLPLSVQLKPIKENETNRTGIYFTIKDTADRFTQIPTKKTVTPAPKVSGNYILDGKTINVFVSPAGKKINFVAQNSLDSIKVVKGGDLDEVLVTLTEKVGDEKAKENIKNFIKLAIAPQIKPVETEDSPSVPDDGEEESPESKKFFSKGKKEAPKPAARIEVTEEDEIMMSAQVDDIEDDIALRVVVSEEIGKFEGENWNKIEKWLKDNFPLLPVYRVKNVIESINGAQAWGMLKNGAIYVSENAEVGTIYHEVFEGIWKIFTTPEEQKTLTNEFKSRKGSFIDRPTGKTINYSEATDFQIKEQLAEEFRDYILYKKSPVRPEGKSLISRLFSEIVNFIKSFFTGKDALSNTEKLFQKIGNGYYKQYTPTSQLSFAKKGIIDIEDAYADSFSQLRVKNLPADVVNDIMQQMTYLTFADLFKNNKSLFSLPKINKTELYSKLKTDVQKTALKSRKEAEDLVSQGKYTTKQAEPIIAKSIALWKNITNEWDQLVQKHTEYLKVYSIEFDENDEVTLTDEDASKKGDYQDANKIDIFKKANSAIKLLLSTIPRVNNEGKLVYSSINGASLLPTSEVFMAIMNKVHSAKNINEMMERLKEMSEEDSNYKTLYNRLMKNASDLSQVSEIHDAQLITAFWRTFKKQNPDVKNVYIFENGEVEVGDSNLATAARQISSEYSNSIVKTVKGTNPYFEYSTKDRVYVGKPNSTKNIKLGDNQNRIDFLKSLGIEFTLKEINKLPAIQSDIFKQAVAGIKSSIEKAGKIVTINGKVLDIKGRLMQLSLIRAAIDNPEFDSTFFNVKGERTQSFIGTNPLSDLYDILSQISNKNELLNTPFEYLLTDSFAQNSVILNKIFNPETGNRIQGGEQLMKIGYADGTINSENGKKKQSSKLTYKERLIQEINLNLKGYYYNLVPGDASMEWMIYMGNPVTSDNLLSGFDKVNDIFKGYFISELALSRENRSVVGDRNSKDLRFLKSVLGEELQNKVLKEKGSEEVIYNKYKSQIDNAVKKFIENDSKQFRTVLESYGIVKTDVDGIVVENLSFSKGETINEEVLVRNLNALSASFMINNIELHKLFYSDPYQYSDELKRVKNANSPRQSIINNSPEFNASLNKLWNAGYNQDDIGYTDMTKDYFKTITLSDVVSTSDLKDYGNFEETDGGGIISMKSYRWFRIKAGEWNDNEERQYKYDIAYEKDKKGIKLSESEIKLLSEGNPNIKSTYTPIKPIVFGNKGNQPYNNVVLDKFALYPLSYRIMHSINPESNAIKHYNKMQREGIDYGVFSTGRKVGSEGTNSLYNPDGSFNQLPYKAIVNIPHSIISIQSEVPSKDEPLVTRGSQITKLATLDYMEAGVPIDFGKGSFKERFTQWNDLSEKQKTEQSPLYGEIKHNQELLELLIQDGFNTLIERMGISEDEDGNFIITDTSKIAETLKSEILKREVNDNIIDAFEGFKNGDVVLEATPAYQQIRNILYSLADKNVISPKISGGQKVQIPSTLLESVRAKEEKGAYTSDVLKFYEDKDGKRVAEIMIGRWFDSSLTEEQLLNFLNKTEQGKSILSGIAFRIPTQKQNSIDSFVVKQFLPQEFGDSVVIPSALVKKVGSDFDIDKLFIYLKNIFKDQKGNIKLIEYKGSERKTKEFYLKLYENTLESDIFKIDRFQPFRDKVVSIFKTIEGVQDRSKLTAEGVKFLLGEEDYEFYTNHIDKLNEISAQSYEENLLPSEYITKQTEELQSAKGQLEAKLWNDELKKNYVQRMYKKSLENAYIQSLQNMVSHPLNFENLVKPNSADQLKALSKEVTKLLGVGEFDYKSAGNMLSRDFMSRLRHAFVSGKYAIGIAAVNQTNHSLNQRQPIYIDNNKWDIIPQEDKFWLSGGTLNKEDVTIKFPKFNTIEVNERIVPTLSMIKNPDGDYISDIIGQFIDGYVDISKGPWIMELGAAPNVASAWLFLIKAGVPVNDVAYFMNQPIIKDYLKEIESAGYSWLFIEDFVDAVSQNEKYDVSSAEVNKIKQIPSNLKSTVGKNKLSSKEKAEQQFILKEFLKYAKMANHMFLITQGSNFDTAAFNDPYLVFKKHEQLKKAQSTIVSSVNDLMKNSFIGKLSDIIYSIRDAFSTVLISDRNNVREVIETVLKPYVELPDREFVKLAQKAVNDLFDWAVQTDRGLNNQVTKILLSDNNTAKQVSDFVVSVRKNDKHPLYNNQVIKLITPHFSSKENSVNNLKIKNKDNKVYDQNQMIYAFSELKNYLNGQGSPLYGALVRLAVLQSGLSNSPISFTSLLPYEDFKEIYNKTLSTLENMPNLQDYVTLNVLQRNNWNNDDLVPVRKARWKQNKNGEWKYNGNMQFFGNRNLQKAIANKELPQLLKINTLSREADNDIIVYTWEVGTKTEKAEKKKKGDYSYIKKGLYKKVYQGDQPLSTSFTIGDKVITDYIYKPINAWGDSHSSDGMYFSANEFYTTGRPSVIDNGFIKVEKEVSDETVTTYFTSSESINDQINKKIQDLEKSGEIKQNCK